jgi:hypothetical protein
MAEAPRKSSGYNESAVTYFIFLPFYPAPVPFFQEYGGKPAPFAVAMGAVFGLQ